jgi:DNA-binding response OmpR family regulator
MHLLVIEDDPRLLRLLRRLLGQDGHVVEGAGTATEGLDIAEDLDLDAIVLDVGLPDFDGFEVARRLRKRGATIPILMLTARDAVASRVQGLDAGADDYLIKPFAYEELAARLRALSRRPSPRQTPDLAPGRSFSTRQPCVTVDGRDVVLGLREFAVLECLLRRPGRSPVRDQLLDYAWPYGAALTPNTVEAYIHILRRARPTVPPGSDRARRGLSPSASLAICPLSLARRRPPRAPCLTDAAPPDALAAG